ncbi:ABC transporter substrate-binding protein [Streptomyces millisiae]|uniref:ABC transporter substrate-binding protein n=1 Tax=Streptomyces millisiae TaxID=3075542 RepID=A0ABU2LM96_9ACTN|nr:ABC transporter substrate-binding protein [Streptomyces sp. DSM 44918]MDT0318707.1 ABC transporter substrate-binding protein [Streptomyces sp. DSM 44918]
MSLRRRSLLGAGTGLGLAALAGCGAGSGGAPDLARAAEVPRGEATVRWWSFPMATNDGDDLRRLLIEAFRSRHPNITVTTVDAPAVTDISRSVLSTAVASGAASPDLYMGDVAWPAQFAHNALALPLDEVVGEDYWRAYPESLVHALGYRDDTYAFPFFADQAYLFYRRDLLDRHGLDVPASWEELTVAARTVQRAGDAEYGLVFQGAVYEGLTANVAEFVADAGGEILNAEGTRVTLGGRSGERALTFLRDLVADGVTPRAVGTFREQDSTDAFVGGRAVFLRNWAYVWGVVEAPDSPVAGRVGVVPRPGFEGAAGSGNGCLGGWCNFVNPHSENPGAAVAFARFCAEEEAQVIMVRNTAYLPALSAVRAGAEARRSPTPVTALADEVRLVPRPTRSPHYPQVSKALYTEVNTVLSGGASPTEALERARAGIADALEGNAL